MWMWMNCPFKPQLTYLLNLEIELTKPALKELFITIKAVTICFHSLLFCQLFFKMNQFKMSH